MRLQPPTTSSKRMARRLFVCDATKSYRAKSSFDGQPATTFIASSAPSKSSTNHYRSAIKSQSAWIRIAMDHSTFFMLIPRRWQKCYHRHHHYYKNTKKVVEICTSYPTTTAWSRWWWDIFEWNRVGMNFRTMWY